MATAPARRGAPPRRGPAAAPAARGRAAPPARSSGYSGAAGRAKMEEAQARAEAQKEARAMNANTPFRFFMAPGDTREIVIIDEAPDWFRYEHNLQSDSGRWDVFTACLNEHTNCPVCSASQRQPYFAMYLTILDLTPYTNRDDEEIPWSKKLLVVKAAQQKKIMRLFERHGTLRGMVLTMSRDSDKDAQIGNDIEFVEFMDEDALAEYVTEYEDREGKVHEVIGSEPFDYDMLFPEPTEEMLEGLVGGRGSAGSRSSDRRELSRDNRRPSAPSSRGGRGGRAAPADDWEEPEAPPRRGRAAADDAPPARRSAVAPARRAPAAQDDRPARRSPRAAQDEFPDDDIPFDDAAGDDAPAPRAAAPSQSARRTPAPRGRAAEPEADDNDPPQRATSIANRRAQLRRG